MLERRRLLLVVAPILLVLLVPLLPTSPAAGEAISARLLDVDALYGTEAWKYSTNFEGVGSPTQIAGHLQNRTATYYGALGLRAIFKVQLYDTREPTKALADSAYNLTAYIPTLRGPLYAYVSRAPGAAPGPSNSDIFYLHFDLDGTNNGDPLGRYPPALEPGLRSVHIDITKRYNDVPTTRPVGSADLPFTYEIPATTVEVPAFNSLPFLQSVPDSGFRLFNDIGWGPSVLFVDRAVPVAAAIQLIYTFASEGRPVKLFGFLAERGVQAAGQTVPVGAPGLPFVPGVSDNETLQNQLRAADALIIVNPKELASGTTGADGSVTFTVTGDNLLNIRPSQPPTTALVVLAPVMEPNLPDTPDPLNYAGGAHIKLGASELVVPVSDRRAAVERYELIENTGGANNLPDAVRGYARAVNGLKVDVRDVDGFLNQNPPQVRTGDLLAIVPDVHNEQALGGTSLAPTQSDANLLRGILPVKSIQDQGVTNYRILALLYRENDAFYTLTYGDRGYQITAAATPAPLGTASQVYVNLTSRNTNYDLLQGENAFELRVILRVAVAELQYNNTRTVTLTEGGLLGLTYPFTTSRTGDVRVDVDSTTGDTAPRPLRVNMNFYEPPVKKTLADRLPGFEAALASVALALALGLVGLGRRRGAA